MEARQPVKVVCFFPEPTPYRAPLLDRISEREDVDLTTVYSAPTVAGRTWKVEPRHRALLLRGRAVPGMRRVLRHDYPVTPGVWRLLEREAPDVVVVSGWSTFASQAAILWCRRRKVPYLVVVESHDRDPRAGWRRAVKWAVVPRLLARASGALVTGSLARASMLRAGVPPDRIWTFANTVDVASFAERAAALRGDRDRIRRELGIGPEAVVVASVSRLVSEKALDVLLRASAEAGVLPLLAGDGPERESLGALAAQLGVPAVFVGDLTWDRVVEVYAASDLFALLSRHEPWGVVVNEAAACGLPLVLSEHVGAAADLVVEGENGFTVAVGDVSAAADAMRRLAEDPALRASFGARSAEIARPLGYEQSVDGFLAGVARAARDRG